VYLEVRGIGDLVGSGTGEILSVSRAWVGHIGSV
jgi:hypothetical protein